MPRTRRVFCACRAKPSDHQKQVYLPQIRMTSMLQAAAARVTVPLQRIRWVTCRHANNIYVTGLHSTSAMSLINYKYAQHVCYGSHQL